MRKILFRGLAAVLALCVLLYGALLWQNNHAATAPSVQDIAASREKSVAWLLKNREAVVVDNNPVLWWMIGESAALTGDQRLRDLLAEFRQRTLAKQAPVWGAFFEPSRFWGANVETEVYAGLEDYQQYFLFGLTCSRQLAELPAIQAQHDLQFCWKSHPISPACTTHQLMAYRFMQRSRCDRVERLEERIATAQDVIERQLMWDPRVVDVYIQRALMLVDSGAPERVRPRWLQRILAAQLPDGSWSGLQPLLPLGGGRYLGFSAKLMRVGVWQGNLHATAQGLWLTSLLSGEQDLVEAGPQQNRQGP